MSGRDGGDVEPGCPRLGRGLGADGDDRQARTGRGERPGGGAGHEQREIGVGHVGPQLDRPVQREEVGVEDVLARALGGGEQERSLGQLVAQALLRVGRGDEIDRAARAIAAPRPSPGRSPRCDSRSRRGARARARRCGS